MSKTFRGVAVGFFCAALSSGCGSDDNNGTNGTNGTNGGPTVDETAPMFDPERIVEVTIELPEADWDALRTQTRSVDLLMGEDCLAEPFGSPFTYREASVTVDGQVFDRVGVRKKGFFGSLDDEKPSLKVKFDEYVPNQKMSGLSRLTLNNNRQDPSHIRQCLGYRLFADAGVPAPRCNFAHVTVNGRDMGIFSHVESVKKRFLARHFDDNDGRLYEGTLADFRPGWDQTFEAKTLKTAPDRSDIAAMVTALEASDANLRSEVEALTSIDRFTTFWAMEALLAHWDGYAQNTNNFFVYTDPTTGLIEFMPWGIDQVLPGDGSDEAPPDAPAVLTNGILARRLYQLPETQALYYNRVAELLDGVWDVPSITEEIDRMETLIADGVSTDALGDRGFAGQVEGVRAFIAGRRSQILPSLSDPPAIQGELRDSFCFVDLGTIAGFFDTTFGTAGSDDVFAAGTGTLTGTIENEDIPTPLQVGSTAGYDEEDPSRVQVAVMAQTAETEFLAVVLNLAPQQIQPGTVNLQIFGAVAFRFNTDTEAFEIVGMVSGTVSFEQAGTGTDAPVVGTFSGTLLSVPF